MTGHPWLRPGVEAVQPAVYAGQPDRRVVVVRVDPPTRRVWVTSDGGASVREMSTFHLRPITEENQ